MPRLGRADAALAGPVLDQAAEKVLTVPPPAPVRDEPPVIIFEPKRQAVQKPPPVVAEPPLPDDPGPLSGPVTEEVETPPRRRFRLFDWLAGPVA